MCNADHNKAINISSGLWATCPIEGAALTRIMLKVHQQFLVDRFIWMFIDAYSDEFGEALCDERDWRNSLS